MKKLLLAGLVMFCACLLNSQSIDILVDGAAFSMTSPNGVYIAGNMEDAAMYYNVKLKTIKVLEGSVQDDGGCFVWDLNDRGQLSVDWKKQAAIWSEETEFDLLPMPEGLSRKEQAYSAARCITNDGKTIVVSFGDPTVSVYVYTLGEDGIYTMTPLPMPTEDPIFHQVPQFASPMGINDDATRIMGRYRIDTGLEELPFSWEKDADGNWNLRWVALDFIVKGGKTDAVYPGEFEFDGSNYDVDEWQDAYDKAYAEYEQMWLDYEATLRASATGYYYNAVGSLSGMRLSRNGRYANAQISYEKTGQTYPAVIDLELDTVYVFTCRPGGGCLSVNNDGVISIQGAMDYFSWTYVASVEDPTKSVTLTEYTMQRTNNLINLADYMTYETPYGLQVAEGTATLSNFGNGFVSWQYNGFGDNMQYETIVVRFDGPVANEVVFEKDLSVYPNPTTGVLNLSNALTDVQLFDVTGRVVYSNSVVESTIDLSSLANGTYFLVANKEGQLISTKVVKY